MAKIEIPAEEKAKLILETVEDRKAEDPLLMDLRGKTVLADYFIICTGLSNVHIRAISEHVVDTIKENNLRLPQIEGAEVGEWVLMDFGDVILHIMNAEARERFSLEEFWSTPQPRGALPPEPGTEAAVEAGISFDDVDEDYNDEDFEFDESELEDMEFFDEADQELEPLEDEDDDLIEETDEKAVPRRITTVPNSVSRN